MTSFLPHVVGFARYWQTHISTLSSAGNAALVVAGRLNSNLRLRGDCVTMAMQHVQLGFSSFLSFRPVSSPVWRGSLGQGVPQRRGKHLRRSDVLVGRPQRCWLFSCLRVPPDPASRQPNLSSQQPLRWVTNSELWGKGHGNYLASRADLWCDEPLSVRVQWQDATATGVLTREGRLSDGPNVSFHISVVR